MTWDVNGKTILVTGASSGIGLEASVELARKSAKVVMVGRNVERTQRAVEAVKSRSAPRMWPTSSAISRRRRQSGNWRRTFRLRYDRLDVLINNAGAVYKKRTITVDGIEATFAVNHLGYFLLTNLLLDLLKNSAPSRIVTVSSVAHRSGTINFEDIGFERGYWIMRAYNRSKLANVLFAAELARRLAGSGVTSNSLHPGAVNTNIWSGAPNYAKPLISLLLRPFLISAKEGGNTIVRLAADNDLDAVTGQYFDMTRAVPSSPLGQDKELAQRLWDISEKMAGLSHVAQ